MLLSCSFSDDFTRKLRAQITISPLSLDGEDLMQRVTIIGTLMGFRKLCLQALRAVLERRIPFMFMSILDFKSNLRDKDTRVRTFIYKTKQIGFTLRLIATGTIIDNHCLDKNLNA